MNLVLHASMGDFNVHVGKRIEGVHGGLKWNWGEKCGRKDVVKVL